MMNAFSINGIESLESCFQSLLTVSAIGSVVVLLAIAFHLATSKWISATWLYAFWFVVLIRFVLFAVPESPTSVLNLVMQPTAETPISPNDSDTQLFGADERLIFTSDSVIPIPIDEQAASNRWLPLSYWTLTAIAWLVVLFAMICRLGLGCLSVKRLARATTEPPGELLSRFESLKRRLGMPQRIRLRISNELEVPAMAGVMSPIVIVPEWCCHELDQEQLEMVFTHELIHIQRRDGLIQLVAHLIVMFHWFNPLARIAARFVESTRELSCDRRVIEIWKKFKSVRTQLSSAEILLIERKYGKTILDIAGRASLANNASKYNAAFLGGFVGSNRNLIKQRIAMLVNSRSQWWLRNVVAGGFIALLLAVGFTSAQTVCLPCPPAEMQLLPTASVSQMNAPIVPVYETKPVASMPNPPMLASQDPKPDAPVEMHLLTQDGVAEPQLPQTSDPPAVMAVKPLPHHSQPILLNVGEVKDLSFDHKILEFTVNDAAILSAQSVTPEKLRITAAAPGKTEVVIPNVDRSGRMLRFRIVPDVRDLKSKVEKEFPDAKVSVTGTTNGFINLVGQVTTEQVTKINEFVVANSNLPVRNHLSDMDPIAIKIKVYEVSTTKLKQSEIAWSEVGIDLPNDMKSLRSLLPTKRGTESAVVAKIEDGSFENFLTVIKKQSIAKLLDQPVLVAHDGRVAEFLSGGEFPVAVINEQGQRAAAFRSFGTKIHVTPHVHSQDDMTLEIRAEFSEVDKERSSVTGVPGFRSRRINTGMRVKFGESIALIVDNRNEKNGDKESSELVFLLTPRLVESGIEFNGPEFKLSREAAALKKAHSESSKKR